MRELVLTQAVLQEPYQTQNAHDYFHVYFPCSTTSSGVAGFFCLFRHLKTILKETFLILWFCPKVFSYFHPESASFLVIFGTKCVLLNRNTEITLSPLFAVSPWLSDGGVISSGVCSQISDWLLPCTSDFHNHEALQEANQKPHLLLPSGHHGSSPIYILQTNTDSAIALVLHSALTYLDKKNIYVKMLLTC